MNNLTTANPSLRFLYVVAFVFGLMTLKSGGGVLFGPESTKLAAGNVVSFVLWFNFLAGFAYIIAAAGLWSGKGWAIALSGLIAILTLLIFVLLGLYIANGGAYENRTLLAMTLRSIFWVVVYYFASRARA